MNCTDHDMACFIPKESNAVSVDVSYNASLTSDTVSYTHLTLPTILLV